MIIEPIAHIKTDFKNKFGLPRQSGRAPALKGEIIFEQKYRNYEAIRGLEQFSHIWIIFDFSEAHRDDWTPTVRPPRLGGNKRIGVFASRSPFRPNNLGLTCAKIDSIQYDKVNGYTIIVTGIDILDNSPIFDIKPYIPYADCIPNAKGGFAEEEKTHFLKVQEEIPGIINILPEEKQKAVIQCLRDDPRPAFHQNPDRIYNMDYSKYKISFRVNFDTLIITEIVIKQE